MRGAFISQFYKLRRSSVLLGTVAPGISTAALTVILTLSNHPDEMRGADGLAHGIGAFAAVILMLVAAVLFSCQFANEYAHGTLRNLLVREPRRLTLLAGIYLASAALMLVAVALATVVSVALAYLLAPGAHLATSAWQLSPVLKAFAGVSLATLGIGVIGASLGVLLRSVGTAVALLLAWLLVVENALAGLLLPASARLLPGRALTAVALHGYNGFSFTRGLVLSAVYTLVFAAAACLVFRRRDIGN